MKPQSLYVVAAMLFGFASASAPPSQASQSKSQSSQQSPVTAARTSPVNVGDIAPDFTLTDQQGGKVTLSAARGQMPVVLIFFRGYW